MNSESNRLIIKDRMVTGLIVLLIIVLIHVFRVGNYLTGKLYTYYYSYASDIIVPFAYYFLLCIADRKMPYIRKWYIKSTILFGLTVFAEILQYFGIYALGKTFDYYDILMYGIGISLAVFFDRLILKRILKNWDYQ